MMQPGFFDWQNRLEKLDKTGDPLLKINTAVNWELFRTEISKLRDKPRRSNAGAKTYDAVMMFKVLIGIK
jgi:IS5 family transposase